MLKYEGFLLSYGHQVIIYTTTTGQTWNRTTYTRGLLMADSGIHLRRLAHPGDHALGQAGWKGSIVNVHERGMNLTKARNFGSGSSNDPWHKRETSEVYPTQGLESDNLVVDICESLHVDPS